MPSYPWLFSDTVDGEITPKKMRALRSVGVPFTDEAIASSAADVDGKPEIQALIAYLQQLGTVMSNRR
jgi:cytochrome c oxidase cbb3-type subunit 2